MKEDLIIYTESENDTLTVESEIRPNWIRRIFKKVRKGSLRASIIILLVTSLGAGPLSYIHPMHNMGIIICLIITIIVLFNYIFCIDLLTHAHQRAPRAKTLNQIIEINGGKNLRKLYDFLFCVNLYIILIAIILCISKLIYHNFSEIIFEMFNLSLQNRNFEYVNYFLAFLNGFIIFLILLRKSLAAYHKIALYCFGIYLFMIIILIIQTPIFYKETKKKNQNIYNLYNCNISSFFQNLGIICYTFNCTSNFYEITKGVVNPSKGRILKIFKITFFLFALILLCIGIISYLMLGNQASTIDLIIFRESIGKNDNLMIFGRSILIFNFLLAGALNTYPLKQNILSLLGKVTNGKDALVSFLLCMTASFISSIFTKVINYFSFTGSLTCMLACFTIPGIIGIKTGFCETVWKKRLLVLWVIVVTILSLVCSFFSLLKFFE